ncbi:hypothetical protein MSAN_00866000 [Mycena sanguinolenta]|uniref:Uncharacterized protein n=1 Tax=Mycena sanguinolenta TaxID=230812 RepID=A0A8H6YZT9_9AGAR|nr:hypothetical protein MSAN_00866000 [Mycena sanguinolenta]
MLLVGVHAVAVVAAVKGWFIQISITKVDSVQTWITAALQATFMIIVGALVALVREFAVDEDIRHPPTLGVLHLRLNAWSGLASALFAYRTYFRSTNYFTPPSPSGLKTIMLYLACCALLQVSSGSIFTLVLAPRVNPTTWSSQQEAFLASRFGNFDVTWPATLPATVSSSDVSHLPLSSQNAARAIVPMFPVRPNHTRFPGLQGRLLHDLVNPENFPSSVIDTAWSMARVDATLVNIHCSQITNATVSTFTLPTGSTDLDLAQPSPRNGSDMFIFHNISEVAVNAVWINVSMPKPPYWPAAVPGLNIIGYWGSYDDGLTLPTKVYFQPWTWDRLLVLGPPGHNQVVMVVATQSNSSFLVDAAGSPGAMLNLSQYQEPNPADGGHGVQAYIQVIGCTARNQDLPATIDPQGRLLDPLTRSDIMIGFEGPHDDHTWDEFQWQNPTAALQTERQFLLSLTPNSPAYNDTSLSDTSGRSSESLLANLLDGSEASFTFIGTSTQRNALVTFQGALERLYASYLWNVNTLCTPPTLASINWAIQPYLQGCQSYSVFSTEVDLEILIPAVALAVVKWRAIASLVSCVLMWLIGSSFVAVRRPIQHAEGLLDYARILGWGSRIPEVVTAETRALSLKSPRNVRRELFNSIFMRRLRYVEDDRIEGYLDIDDSRGDVIPPQN